MNKQLLEVLARKINNLPHDIVQTTQDISDLLEALAEQYPDLCCFDKFNLVTTQLRLTNREAHNLIAVAGSLYTMLANRIEKEKPVYAKPSVTADICLYRCVPAEVADTLGKLEVALVQRKNEPFINQWAWPGGFVNEGESVEAAAYRELQEETTVSGLKLVEFGSMSDPGRDPRGWVISHCFMAEAGMDTKLDGKDDAKEAKWFEVAKIPMPMAFDHEEILKKLLAAIKRLSKRSQNDT